jgi:hypothetical protein
VSTAHPFGDLPPAPAEHFKLYFYAAVLQLLNRLVNILGSAEAVFEAFPFLEGYHAELAARGLGDRTGLAAGDWWRQAVCSWEADAHQHLPIRALRNTLCLDHGGLLLVMLAGLIEEDPRFGLVFDFLQGHTGQPRPSLGLLQTWSELANEPDQVRASFRRCQAAGLLQVPNADGPRSDWALQVPIVLWDATRGEAHESPTAWARYRPPEALPTLDELVLAPEARRHLAPIPALLESSDARVLVVRGPSHNGRRTTLAATARSLNRGVLELSGLRDPLDERWKLVGPLATLLHALPVVLFDLAPAETAEVPHLPGLDGPLGVVLGRQGGLSGAAAERAITLSLDVPDAACRRVHWQRSLGVTSFRDLDPVVNRFRLTAGNLRRVAHLAQPYARLGGRAEVTLDDVRQASRTLNRQALDTLAAYVPTSGDWSQLAVEPDTLYELRSLESRCRQREQLAAVLDRRLGAYANVGIRALFSGPSGSGKTLAARLLAASLRMDLYRLDLSTVVNKYIGETEKNLSQVFARAEELDVILLLDEGDALLAQRTSVQTANDRYANLETNYLLQRLETFEGILIVTSNASHRIDEAFQRRMDVVIQFRPPDVGERWAIWQLHLPPSHAVQPALLAEVARRCDLSGGQIRNAVLHASLLGLEDGGRLTSEHLQAAIQREYRKMGGVCPLRTTTSGATGA